MKIWRSASARIRSHSAGSLLSANCCRRARGRRAWASRQAAQRREFIVSTCSRGTYSRSLMSRSTLRFAARSMSTRSLAADVARVIFDTSMSSPVALASAGFGASVSARHFCIAGRSPDDHGALREKGQRGSWVYSPTVVWETPSAFASSRMLPNRFCFPLATRLSPCHPDFRPPQFARNPPVFPPAPRGTPRKDPRKLPSVRRTQHLGQLVRR